MPKTIAAKRLGPSGRVLVLGIGNPGRRDDGLGPHLVERLRALSLTGVMADANYQLQIEDALTVAPFDRVVFVDAARSGVRTFRLVALKPRAEIAFTTHALSPRSVLALARELYGKSPAAHLLAIRGFDFRLGEGLSDKAAGNLEAALARLAAFIAKGPKAVASRRRARSRARKPL